MGSETRRTVGWARWVAAVLLGMMAVVSFANILSRYLFHYSFAFTEELTVNLFVWMTVVGAGIGFERGAHLGMVSLYRLFPRGVQRWCAVGAGAVGALLFVVIDLLLVSSIRNEVCLFRTMSSLGVPVWVYYAGVVALSPAVFVGIYRSVGRELAGKERSK